MTGFKKVTDFSDLFLYFFRNIINMTFYDEIADRCILIGDIDIDSVRKESLSVGILCDADKDAFIKRMKDDFNPFRQDFPLYKQDYEASKKIQKQTLITQYDFHEFEEETKIKFNGVKSEDYSVEKIIRREITY